MTDFNDLQSQDDSSTAIIGAIEGLPTRAMVPASKKAGKRLQRPYAALPTAIWSDAHYAPIRQLPSDLFKLYWYLASSPYSNSIGLYRITLGAMMGDLHFTAVALRDGLEILEQAGLIQYNLDSEHVWVIHTVQIQMTDANGAGNGNQLIGMRNVFHGLPPTPLKAKFAELYREVLHLV